jgi:hypothetical protein
MPFLVPVFALIGITISVTTAWTIGLFIVSFVISAVSTLLRKTPTFPSLSHSDRTLTVRQPIAPWRIIYGRARIGGMITFLDLTGANNEFLQIVITLAGHQLQSIDAMYFDGVAVPLDGSGNATGTFAGFVHVEFNLGTAGQASFAGLVAADSKWTVNHKQSGRAGAYVQLKWSADLFPSGMPNITFDVHGQNVFDPRNSTTAYSENAALCLRDYLLNTSFGLGVSAGEIDDTQAIAAANLCDEAVTLLAGGTEPRYTMNGSFEASSKPVDLIQAMLTAMAGRLVYSAGQFRIFPGSYQTATISLSEADIRAAIKVQTRMNKRDLFNGVKGIFLNPAASWRPTDYPAYQDATYLAQDQSEVLWKDVEFPFTISAATAQRLSKIDLERIRRQVTVLLPCKLSAYQIAVLDTIQLSIARYGWVNKTFEVTDLLVSTEDAPDGPLLGVDLTLRETDATVFNWSTANEKAMSALPSAPSLPNARIVAAPTNLALTSGAGGGPIAVATDNFNRASLGANWTAISGSSYEISASTVVRLLSGGNQPARWNANTFNADQYAQIVFTSPGTGAFGVSCRIDTGGADTHYSFYSYSGTGGRWLFKRVAGAQTVLASDALGSVNGDVLRLEIVGTQVTAKINGTILFQITDSSIASGAAGMVGGGTVQTTQGDNWEGGNMSGGASTTALTRADGVRISRIKVTWTSPADQFVLNGGRIVIESKRSADTNWTPAGSVDGLRTEFYVANVDDGVSYDVRIWAENASGAKSSTISVTGHVVASIGFGHATYRPLANAVTGHDAGANVTVNVAAFTMRIAGLSDKSINSGSVTALSYSTLYFIYYDDATFAGGAVTFQATTTRETAINGAGRFFVGSVTAPASGGPDTTGNNDGGAGAQSGGLFTSLPSASAVGTLSTNQFTTPNKAWNQNPADAATSDVNSTTTGKAQIYKGFGSITLPAEAKSVTLYILQEAIFTAPVTGAAQIFYSLDGGATFNSGLSLSAGQAKQVNAIALPLNTNFGALQVQPYNVWSSGAGDIQQNVYEIWVEVIV